jgi:hypothetical protein
VEEKANPGINAAIEFGGEPVWVGRETALQHCPVSPTTLWRISNQPDSGIRTTRVGRRVFYDLNSIKRFMEAHACSGTEE